ncbi:MAG TPA: hypothetical protein DCP28_17310 [Cytophagales bacterium]|nr:hypothetical protein [Cytophagales bacterium]
MKNTVKMIAFLAILSVSSYNSFAQLLPPIDRDPCANPSTTLLHVGTPYVNSVSLTYGQTVTWYTNAVCGATTYFWTLKGSETVTTSVPQITLAARDLIWLPAGGCDEFNDDWMTFPHQWATVGTYHTTMSVRSNITSYITLPVSISGVTKCEEWDPFGDEDDGSGGGGFGG